MNWRGEQPPPGNRKYLQGMWAGVVFRKPLMKGTRTGKGNMRELKEPFNRQRIYRCKGVCYYSLYTSPEIIGAIYQGLSQFGFKQGTVLEPSAGVGHFFGAMPEEMRGSRLYGVEKDSVSGGIAKLYIRMPKSRSAALRKHSSRITSLMWQWAISPLGTSSSMIRSTQSTTSVSMTISLRRLWIRSDRAVLLPLSQAREHWIKRIRVSANIWRSGQSLSER